MSEIIKKRNFEDDGHHLDGASLEKSLSYETEQGVITEKTTLSYKRDSGNAIDKTINEIRESEYIKKAGNSAKSTFLGTLKLSLVLGVAGFVIFIIAIMAGLI